MIRALLLHSATISLLAFAAIAFGATALKTEVNAPVEWGAFSAQTRSNPWQEIELDAIIRNSAGREWRVPGFWAGGLAWRFRFSAGEPGTYQFRTVCSDPGDTGLHGQTGTIQIAPGTDERSALLAHGPIRISENKRHFIHADETPFFWLADQWWFGMSTRLRYPDEFNLLVRDRVEKGFSVISFAIAFPCDIAPFDPRGANEAGHAWTTGFDSINPAYFDHTDQRLRTLVDAGLVPNIVGAWGYYLPAMGVEKMKRHWRYLIARYGAFPIVWTVAGESTLTYYDLRTGSPEKAAARKYQIEGWSDVAAYLRRLDPYARPMTVHPGPNSGGLQPIADLSSLDFIFLQPGHSDWETLGPALTDQAEARRRFPRQPSLIGEANFEGMHGGGSGPKIQRFLFWTTVLSGAPGFSYGTDATWQFNRRGDPFGPSPHGMAWGNIPWEEGYQFTGSLQVGLGRRILAEVEWWKLEPHQEWITPAATPKDFMKPFCAGVPGRLRVVFLPKGMPRWAEPFRLRALEPGVRYTATYVDPITGKTEPAQPVQPDANGDWPLPYPPILQDWVLILKAAGS
jgi:hypothetical protein